MITGGLPEDFFGWFSIATSEGFVKDTPEVFPEETRGGFSEVFVEVILSIPRKNARLYSGGLIYLYYSDLQALAGSSLHSGGTSVGFSEGVAGGFPEEISGGCPEKNFSGKRSKKFWINSKYVLLLTL